jgi:hypothetical protein
MPNWRFNADANIGHAFGIFMASVGALRPYGLRRRLTWALGVRGREHMRPTEFERSTEPIIMRITATCFFAACALIALDSNSVVQSALLSKLLLFGCGSLGLLVLWCERITRGGIENSAVVPGMRVRRRIYIFGLCLIFATIALGFGALVGIFYKAAINAI